MPTEVLRPGAVARRRCELKTALIVGAAAGAVIVGRRVARGCGGFDFEKMIERMPENAPPKWMFRNISAIRTNTDRILELLDSERAPASGERVRTAA